ncbi:MAG TPA: LLM class flavin-dependent oxidoreductase [Chloroflexota bacterium]|nr:LLM class flavin-dependent oxidoreductase [Chloroflexota bacterium]
MRFHMHLLPTYFPGEDPPFDGYFRQVLEQVQLAEELGFECYWFTEHHFVLYGGPVPNPALIMSAAAARTSRIHLGSAISILPLHHPVQIAEDYAMVDVVSGGRLEFGVGIGNAPGDFEVYGVPRDESRERFEEALEIITKAWTKDSFKHDGRFWRLPDAAMYPRPIQKPHPPIWLAGTSESSLRMAGLRGFNIMTVAHPFPPERLRPSVAAYRAGLAEGGHDPATHFCKLHVRVWIEEDGAHAKQVAERAIQRYDERQIEARIGVFSSGQPRPSYDWEGMRAQGRNVYGTPEECIRGIEATRSNYDFDILSVTFNFGGIPHAEVLKAMRLFAAEVMPRFRGDEPATGRDGAAARSVAPA